MKRTGNLYDQIISINNLYLAEKKARRGKASREEIIEFVNNLDENIINLHLQLLSQTYTTGEYYRFTIYEPKQREIDKLPYKDRVVHHAILNILESLFVSFFITNTYSCIKKRGIHKCLRDLNKSLKNVKDTKYCLKIDIKKFYPSISHNILKKLLRTKFKDEKLLHLLDNIIDSISGIPLGSYTSQWFGNFYLNKFDHWVKEKKKIKYYYRYCDDIVILGNDKEELHILRKEIQEYLKTNLELELSNYQVFPVSKGIDFLGYVSYPIHVKLRKSIKKSFIKMVQRHPNRKSISSYWGWIKHCNGKQLWGKYIINNPKIIKW